MREWLIGIVIGGVLFGALLKWGIPALVEWIVRVASLKTKRLIWLLTPPIVDVVEVLSKEYDWHGEDKMMEAIRRLEEEIGKLLKPDEVLEARLAINAVVAEKNAQAVARFGAKKFAAELVKERRT